MNSESPVRFDAAQSRCCWAQLLTFIFKRRNPKLRQHHIFICRNLMLPETHPPLDFLFLGFWYVFLEALNFYSPFLHFHPVQLYHSSVCMMEEDFIETFDAPGTSTEAKKAEISHFETVVKSFLYYEHHGSYDWYWVFFDATLSWRIRICRWSWQLPRSSANVKPVFLDCRQHIKNFWSIYQANLKNKRNL